MAPSSRPRWTRPTTGRGRGRPPAGPGEPLGHGATARTPGRPPSPVPPGRRGPPSDAAEDARRSSADPPARPVRRSPSRAWPPGPGPAWARPPSDGPGGSRPSRWPTAPASTKGRSRNRAHGAKADSRSRAAPPSTAVNPPPLPAPGDRGAAPVGDDPVPPARAPGRQAQDRDDDELPQDQGHQRVDQTTAPVGDGRPGQAGQGQREEQDGHVDGGGPDEQLDPHQHRPDHHGQGPQERARTPASPAEPAAESPERPVSDRGHEVAGVEPGPVGHRGAHGVGHRQPQLRPA